VKHETVIILHFHTVFTHGSDLLDTLRKW